MQGPELVVSPRNLDELRMLIDAGADAFVLGSSKFVNFSRGSFYGDSLSLAVDVVRAAGRKVYLSIEAIMSNDLIDDLRVYLESVRHLDFDGVRVVDPGAFLLVRELMSNVSVHFTDSMMLVNYFTANYWMGLGASRVKLASEIVLDDVLRIKGEASGGIEVLVHGASMMFTSRRKLVANYLDFLHEQGKDVTMTLDGNFLFDEERNLYYPILENEHGTHILSGSDVCMIDDLDGFVDAGIDAFYVDGFVHDSDDFCRIVGLYRMAIDLLIRDRAEYDRVKSAIYNEIVKLQSDVRPLDSGFYYKPTIYKNKV